MAAGWRYIAQRLDGNGPGQFIDFEVPLNDVQITDTLSGHNALTGTLDPEVARFVNPDGSLVFGEWETAIFAENQGEIRGGGIVTHTSKQGPSWNLECSGYTGYLDDLPWSDIEDATFFVRADPMDIYRHIWNIVQSKPRGNLGLEIGGTKSEMRIGVELEQAEYDTQSGPIAFESGPYRLAWYETTNLGDNANQLAQMTPFDWHERHFWDGDTLRHVVDLGYPRIGRRRDDLRFVVGENVMVAPSVERSGEDYASEVLVLGAGQGREMKRGTASRPGKGLRRVAVVADSSLQDVDSANNRAEQEMAWRSSLDEISEIGVRSTSFAPLGSVQVGDEILIQSRSGWAKFDMWVRVLSITISPGNEDGWTMSVARTEKLAG